MKLASGRALSVYTGCHEVGGERVRGQVWENYLRSSEFGLVSDPGTWSERSVSDITCLIS